MNKGIFDIIRPQWLFDSITSKELVPLSRKYFFHATAERMESEEYYNEDGDLELEPEDLLPGKTALRMSGSPSIHTDAGMSESREEDPTMRDWLQIGPASNDAENLDDDADSVTDPDSGAEDNWFSIKAPQQGGAEVSGTEVILCARLR